MEDLLHQICKVVRAVGGGVGSTRRKRKPHYTELEKQDAIPFAKGPESSL